MRPLQSAIEVGVNSIPPKVAAAQEYLRYAQSLIIPPPAFDGGRVEPRDLSLLEQIVYDAALQVLRMYFTGEQEFEKGIATEPSSRDDNGPTDRVPVTQ